MLSAGVAHEINNPIGFVLSNVSTLDEYTKVLKTFIDKAVIYIKEPNEYHRDDAQHYLNAGNIAFILEDISLITQDTYEGLIRVKDIVASLKQFARADSEQVEAFDLNENIDNTIKIAWNEMKYHVLLVRDLDDQLPLVLGHPGQINQVVLNMLVNAAQSIEGDGQVIIRTRKNGEFVLLEIEDTGSGMTEDVKAKIFDPFFSTKDVSQGTGLGLSISYGIIEKQGGRIEVSTEVGKGTCFSIYLPIAE